MGVSGGGCSGRRKRERGEEAEGARGGGVGPRGDCSVGSGAPSSWSLIGPWSSETKGNVAATSLLVFFAVGMYGEFTFGWYEKW